MRGKSCIKVMMASSGMDDEISDSETWEKVVSNMAGGNV